MDSRRVDMLLDAPERRAVAVSDFEVRTVGDDLRLEGYASVFDEPYEVHGGPDAGGWTETVDRGAFDVTLREKPDVHLLVNHEGMPLARTKSGTMTLDTDKRGLRVGADLDRRDPDVRSLEVKMGRGDIDEMSFAFRTKRHQFDEEKMERRLLEVSIHKGDVSVVNFGANPATSAQLRELTDALEVLANADVEEAMLEVRSLKDPADRLKAARSNLARLIANLEPSDGRLSVAEARQLAELS